MVVHLQIPGPLKSSRIILPVQVTIIIIVMVEKVIINYMYSNTVRSRSLLSLEHQTSFQSFACSWFHHVIILHRGLGYFCTDMCGDNEGGEVHLHMPSSIKELANVSGHRYNIDSTILYSSLHTSNN